MSDIARHAGKTAWRDMDGLSEESRAMRRFSKGRVSRNRRRAEPAIVAEQLAHDAGHDDGDVLYPGCDPA